MSNPNIKHYDTRRWIVHNNILHWKPQKQLFLRQTLHSHKLTISEIGSHDAVEVDSGVELGQARTVQEDFEEAIWVERERLDIVREEPSGQALALEEVLNGVG